MFLPACLPLFYLGPVETNNSLVMSKRSKPEGIAKAIIARICTQSHTVVESLGPEATTGSIKVRGKNCVGTYRSYTI